MTIFTEYNQKIVSKYLVPSFGVINKSEFNLDNERKKRLPKNGIHGIKGFLAVVHLIENEPQLSSERRLQEQLPQQEKNIKKNNNEEKEKEERDKKKGIPFDKKDYYFPIYPEVPLIQYRTQRKYRFNNK